MKKILIILFVMLSSSMVFAEVLTQSAVITAVKRGANNGTIPNAEAQIRLVEAGMTEFGEGSTIQLPVSARSESYGAFDWAYGGNFYSGVTIAFSFEPMRKLDEQQSLGGTLVFDNTKYLPYTVEFTYTSTRVGNGAVNINKTPTNLRNELAYWGGTKKYYVSYADAIQLKKGNTNVSGMSTTAAIANTAVTISIAANMSTNSVVYSAATGSTTVAKNTFLNAFTVDGVAHVPVCDHWVRSGNVNVTIDIDPTGSNWTSNTNTKVDDGVYYADVVISFTKD